MKRGTVVLSPFPFTDLSGTKVRPAVAVSRSDRPGNDVILSFFTSYRGQPLVPTDLLILDTHPDFLLSRLKTSSVLKLDKLMTLDVSILLGELGELSTSILKQVDDKIRYSLGL
jgi:mRNA interferase MazF